MELSYLPVEISIPLSNTNPYDYDKLIRTNIKHLTDVSILSGRFRKLNGGPA